MPLPQLKKGSPEAFRWAEKMRKHRERIRAAGLKTEKKFFGPGGPLEVKHNPNMKWHEEAARIAARYSKQAQTAIEKALYKGMQVAHEDSARASKVLNKRPKKNPLAIYNPPDVAGVIYKNAIEIRAEKIGGGLKGFYKHTFGPNVQILGLTNGDVLIRHKHGKRLWISREDHERSGGRHE